MRPRFSSRSPLRTRPSGHADSQHPRSHLSPGRSFQSNAMHVHDLVPYLQAEHKHDFGHELHAFSFGSETEAEFVGHGAWKGADETKRNLGIVNPLDGIRAHTEESN